MSEITIAALVEGGKASTGPPFGPALGPLGVNTNAIIAEINDKTKQYAGVKIPVKVFVDSGTKTYRIEVGSPPTSAMILEEAGLQTGAKAKGEIVGNLTMGQIKSIATAKESKIYGNTMGQRVNQILGTCKSMGITCDGADPREVIKKIKSGELKL
jgi:large subunit ribosomal protein L11